MKWQKALKKSQLNHLKAPADSGKSQVEGGKGTMENSLQYYIDLAETLASEAWRQPMRDDGTSRLFTAKCCACVVLFY